MNRTAIENAKDKAAMVAFAIASLVTLVIVF